MKKASAFFDRLLGVTAVVPGVIIGLLAIGITIEVVARNLNFSGLYWMLDAVEYGLLVLTMVGAAYVLSIGRHVTVDIILNMWSGRWRFWVDVAISTISLLVSLVIVYYGILTAILAYNEDSTLYKSIEIKEWVPMTVVPGGMLLFAIECLRQLVATVRDPSRRRGDDDAKPEVF